jgi:DNA replication protein DnaC
MTSPKSAPERRNVSDNPEEVTFLCPGCQQKVIPTRKQLSGGRTMYSRRECPCELQHFLEQEEARERKERIAANVLYTFTGLTPGYIPGVPRRLDEVTAYLRSLTFANFQESRQPEAYEMARLFVGRSTPNLLLYGPYGTGKSHLLAAICNELIDQGVGCLFVRALDLFFSIQECLTTNRSYQGLLDRAVNTPVLVIDDVDKAPPSAWRQEQYYYIIDKRMMCKKPIAISTNQLQELDRFVGPACVDRLSIGQIVVEVAGASFRKEL